MNDPVFPEHDPFAAPATTLMASQPARGKLPTYCMVMFIVSLVFSCLRVVVVFFSLIGYAAMAADGFPSGNATGYLLEVISGFGMAVFGILGNIGLLCKKMWGLFVAYALVAFVLLSYVSAFLTVSSMMGAADDPAVRTGMLVGIVGASAF